MIRVCVDRPGPAGVGSGYAGGWAALAGEDGEGGLLESVAVVGAGGTCCLAGGDQDPHGGHPRGPCPLQGPDVVCLRDAQAIQVGALERELVIEQRLEVVGQRRRLFGHVFDPRGCSSA
ncbi:hypothetical protein [Embleya sp. NPDC050493]|uniref:hypothetical protein n=1 Tax=Embleya sp. NPDC050493 TaxID=3363989 RepID=UPI0037B93BC5